MTMTDCTTCRTSLPDLLLDGTAAPPSLSAHLATCESCRQEWNELRATWSLMDEWVAPEPSPYFDSRLHARLREVQAEAPEGVWQRITSFLHLGTGRQIKPALAGALALAMLLGGGTAATLLTHHGASPTASPTVNDLKIYDNNAQALQQMDLLDESASDAGAAPQS
jgi:hypothetical protein